MVRIKLGPILNEYSAQLFTWRNDESIFKWCRQVDLLTEAGHEKWMQNHQLDKSIKMYSIMNEDNRLIGVCGFTDIDLVNQRAEFSLYIGPEFQRKGYAKEALNLLLEHGFNHYPFATICGETFVENPAYNMFLKMGFKHEGTRRNFYFKNGKHIDAHLVSITKKEHSDSKNNNHNSVVADSGISNIVNLSDCSYIDSRL